MSLEYHSNFLPYISFCIFLGEFQPQCWFVLSDKLHFSSLKRRRMHLLGTLNRTRIQSKPPRCAFSLPLSPRRISAYLSVSRRILRRARIGFLTILQFNCLFMTFTSAYTITGFKDKKKSSKSLKYIRAGIEHYRPVPF